MTPQSHPSEQEAAATFAGECTNTVEVIRWCADRVRWVDDGPVVQDAADYLHDLSSRVVVDTTAVRSRSAVMRWCAKELHSIVMRWCDMEIHSADGNAAVERAAEYLNDLATEAEEATDGWASLAQRWAWQDLARLEGWTFGPRHRDEHSDGFWLERASSDA